MTTSLVLSSPEALVSSLPYLLGFQPRESAVLVWLDGRRIVLTQRVDLPSDPRDPEWHALLWSHAGVAQSDRLIAVLVSGRTDLPPMAALLVEAAEERGMQVLDVVVSDEGSWSSLLCEDAQCCPAEGRPIREETRTAVAAEFAWEGVASVGERADLVASLAPDPVRVSRVADRLAEREELPGTSAGLEAWRDAAIAQVLAVLAGRADPERSEEAAGVLTGLADIRVRDTVLWTASHWRGERLEGARDALAGVVRAAPPEHLAPVGTVYAGLAWMSGDGARAGVALERALSADGAYSLARLLASAIVHGLHPQVWREAMGALSRVECRHGVGAPGRPV